LLDQKEPKSQASFLAPVPLLFFSSRRTHGPLSKAQLFGVLSFTQRAKKQGSKTGLKKGRVFLFSVITFLKKKFLMD
jgi:hypothetical protein